MAESLKIKNPRFCRWPAPAYWAQGGQPELSVVPCMLPRRHQPRIILITPPASGDCTEVPLVNPPNSQQGDLKANHEWKCHHVDNISCLVLN